MLRLKPKSRAASKPISKASKKKKKKEGKANAINALVPTLKSSKNQEQPANEAKKKAKKESKGLDPRKNSDAKPLNNEPANNSIYSLASDLCQGNPKICDGEEDVYELTDSLTDDTYEAAGQLPGRPTIPSTGGNSFSEYDDNEEDVYEMTDSLTGECYPPAFPLPVPKSVSSVGSDGSESDDTYSHLEETNKLAVKEVSYDALRYNSSDVEEASYDYLHSKLKTATIIPRSDIKPEINQPRDDCYEDVDLPFRENPVKHIEHQITVTQIKPVRDDDYEDVDLPQPETTNDVPESPLPLPPPPEDLSENLVVDEEWEDCNENRDIELQFPEENPFTPQPSQPEKPFTVQFHNPPEPHRDPPKPHKDPPSEVEKIEDSNLIPTFAQAMNVFKAPPVVRPPRLHSNSSIKPRSEVVTRYEFGRIIKPRINTNRSTVEDTMIMNPRTMKFNGNIPTKSPNNKRKNFSPAQKANTLPFPGLSMDQSELAKSPLFLSMQQKLKLND